MTPLEECLLHILPAPTRPLRFLAEKCTGCNRCVEVCQLDVLYPNPERGKPPVVAYPGECWYCGACVMECPQPGAIKLQHPLMNRVCWVPRGVPEAFQRCLGTKSV